jgi:hypothetical protein
MMEGRNDHTLAALNGRLYVAGGVHDDGLGDMWVRESVMRFDIASQMWSWAPRLPAGLYSHAATTLHDGQIYITGGKTLGQRAVATVFVFSDMTNTWSSAPPMHMARSQHASTAFHDALWVCGGQDGDAMPMRLVESFDPMTRTWTQRASLVTPRKNPMLGVLHGVLYVCGGEALRSVERYDMAAGRWEVVDHMELSIERNWGVDATSLN